MIDYFEDEEGFKKVMAIEIARRDYARALYRSGDLLIQELLDVYFHHQRDNRVFERAAELASQLAHFKPVALKKVAGRPIALTDIEKKNICSLLSISPRTIHAHRVRRRALIER